MTKDSQDWLDEMLDTYKLHIGVSTLTAHEAQEAVEVRDAEAIYRIAKAQAKQAIKAHIKQEMMALVGEDDRDYSGDNTDHDSKIFLIAASTACNELRAELRKAIEERYE